MAEYDAIVIGSGAGGLSAALKLSRSGCSVLLLEAKTALGGYLNTFHRKGYTFDTGLHLIGESDRGDTLWRLLEQLGLNEAVEFVELNPEGFDRFVFPDYELKFGRGKDRFVEQLVRDFPREEQGIQKYFKVFDKIVKAGTESAAGSGSMLSMLFYILKHPVMMKYSRVPYQKLLDEVTSDKRLQAVLAANCAYYGVPPAKASVIIAVHVWNHYFNGAFYPRGGSRSFRDAFTNGLQQHGAVLKNRSRVVAIEKRGKEFLVKTASEEQHSSRVVISNADPVLTLGSLVNPEQVPSQIKKKAEKMKPSFGSFYAFVGTDLDLRSLGMTAANIHHFKSYDINEIYENWLNPNSPKDVNCPYFFITSATLKDPDGDHAPAGCHNIEILTGANYEVFKKWANFPSMKRGEDYKSLKENIGQQLLAAAEGYIPDLTQHIDFVEYATPLTNEYWVNAVKGGNYGPIQTPEQVGIGRFMNYSSGIDGLYLAGAGTIGGGVSTCLASGLQAGSKAIRYLEA